MMIRIIQLNARRSKTVAAEVKQKSNSAADIIVLQEPYVYKGAVKGYAQITDRIIQPKSTSPQVAIIVKNKNYDILQLDCNNSDHIVAIEVITEIDTFYIASVYFQHRHKADPYLQQLEMLLNTINKRSKVIICADANARSTLWHSDCTNKRGLEIENFLHLHKLQVLNKPSEWTTFTSTRGNSNIDITLSTQNITPLVKDWKILYDYSTSDHNAISLILEKADKKKRAKAIDKTYNIKTADWTSFEVILREEFGDDVKSALELLNPEEAIELFNIKLEAVCDQAIKKKTVLPRSVPWWNLHLTNLRRKVMSARKTMSRHRKRNALTDSEKTLITKYKSARREYTKAIKESKIKCWQDFVKTEGSKDPWGIVYKIARNKLNNKNMFHAINIGNKPTTSWEETVGKIMGKMVPNLQQTETTEDQSIISQIESYTNSNLESEITTDEVQRQIQATRNKKAPGLDKINPEIIKHVWSADRQILLSLLNNCFRSGVFPKQWKTAEVKILLKSLDKSPSDINSYRPIALLPILGKVYEKILLARIQQSYRDRGMESPLQYGFKPGCSTDDALLRTVSIIRNSDRKYVVAMFLDIAGAFDNLYWPMILHRLTQMDCPGLLYKIMKDYFSNRNMIAKGYHKQVKKKMERGCPQGSIVGPYAWNWCMDVLLHRLQELETENTFTTAYADDLVVIIQGNSRSEIERHAANAAKEIERWCNSNKLKIAAHKTKAMLLKGKLDPGRMPSIRINDIKISYVQEIKYLGLIIDQKLSFLPHIKSVRNKISQLSYQLKGIIREEWGLKQETVMLFYKCLYLPILTYGATVWYDRATLTHINRHLRGIQRILLLTLTRACRTTSTAALEVITGLPPVQYELAKKAAAHHVSRNNKFNWNTYVYNPSSSDSPTIEKRVEYEKFEEAIRLEWQERWENESHGRTTAKFFPTVEYRKNDWIISSRDAVHLITGYGSINQTLYKRKSIDSPYCPHCTNVEETVEHIIFECPTYEDIRYDMLQNQEARNNWNNLINSKEEYTKFAKFAKETFNRRREILNLT